MNKVVLWFDQRENHIHVVETGLDLESADRSVAGYKKDGIPAFHCDESFLDTVRAKGTTVTYDQDLVQ